MRFNGVLCVLDRILVVLVTIFCKKIYFLSHEKPNAGQNCIQTVTSYALILGGDLKSRVFEKIYT